MIKIFFWVTKREQGNLLYGKPFTVELVGNPIKYGKCWKEKTRKNVINELIKRKKNHNTCNVPQPKTRQTYPTEKIEKKQHKVTIYPAGKVTQPNTTQRYRIEKMQNNEHKAKYLIGKVPLLKTGKSFRREKMEKKQDKSKYLTWKVPQPKTTEIYPAEKIEKKQDKVNYLTGNIPKPEREKLI